MTEQNQLSIISEKDNGLQTTDNRPMGTGTGAGMGTGTGTDAGAGAVPFALLAVSDFCPAPDFA